jgi:LysR family transcriptional regulator, low CO2-responsive transcriptional regulator
MSSAALPLVIWSGEIKRTGRRTLYKSDMAIDRRITLHKLEVFELVVELGGVSRAADRLYVAQPVVTAHIRSLEERLGTDLFYREGGRMHLTEGGRAVHAWASDLLRRTRELSRHLDGLSDGSQGSVVLGASMSIGSYSLPPLLSRFRQGRPLVDIVLNILDTEHALADTEAGENDFAVVIAEADPAGRGLQAEKLGDDELVVVAAADGAPAESRISVEQLAELSFVEAPQKLLRQQFVDHQLRQIGVRDRNVSIQLGHPEAMKRATAAGLGVAVLFRSAVREELASGELREIAVEGVQLSGPIYLVYRRDKLFSAVHRDLIAEIRDEFADQGAERLRAARDAAALH